MPRCVLTVKAHEPKMLQIGNSRPAGARRPHRFLAPRGISGNRIATTLRGHLSTPKSSSTTQHTVATSLGATDVSRSTPPETFPQTNGTLRFGATTPPHFENRILTPCAPKAFAGHVSVILVWVVMGDRLVVFKKMRLHVPRGGKAIGVVLAVLAPCCCVPPQDPEA